MIMSNELNLSKEALEYLVNCGQRLADAKGEPVIKEIRGATYVFYDGCVDRYSEVDKKPAPECFWAYTLDGLINWIQEDVNHFFDGEEKCIVAVESPTVVKVYTPCKGVDNKMQVLARCEYAAPAIRFNEYMDSEDFCIMIQTRFEDEDNQRMVLQVARNLVEDQSEQVADDGFSQRLTIKSGIQSQDKTVFKNPAFLRPQRTFTEVAQPQSPFVVRFREGKQAAIFEADGGAWKMDAVHYIGEYLSNELTGCNVVVIA